MSIKYTYYDDEDKKVVRSKTERYDNATVKSYVEFESDGKTVKAVYEGGINGRGKAEEYFEGKKIAIYDVRFTGQHNSLEGREQLPDFWSCYSSLGEINGEFRFYHLNGRLSHQGSAKDGKLNGTCISYYENGQKRVALKYKDGQVVDGEYKVYRDNGELKERICYRKGQANGYYVSYHKGGKISEQTHCVDGKKDGEYTRFDRKGKRIHEGIYQKGERTIINRYNGFKEKDR